MKEQTDRNDPRKAAIPSDLVCVELRCEYDWNPLGVQVAAPRLSWELRPAEGVPPARRRGRRQTAWQVLVASSEEKLAANLGDLWDSRKVKSGQSAHVPYAGKRLRSRMRCFWKVRAWSDAAGGGAAPSQPGPWSEPACFEMGLLHERDWTAKWITFSPPPIFEMKLSPAPMLRKAFTLQKPVRSARACVCGIGYHELYINGEKVGDRVLDPGFTRYDKRALYVTHDVTARLAPGRNTIGIILGNGWFNQHARDIWNFHTAPWRDKPRAVMQLHVDYADGSKEVVCTDSTWKGDSGPIVFDGVRNGEVYDARLEKPGWASPDCDDAAWGRVTVVPGPGGELTSMQMPPVKVTGTITPVSVRETQPGVFLFDMGQNFSGWAQLRASGPAGTKVTIRYAETLKDDGMADSKRHAVFLYEGEFQTDTFFLKGEGEEAWEPRFAYHGFQYVEVTGFPGTPTLDSLRGRVVHTALEKGGEFACSNDLLNRIQAAALWATVSNYHSYPTDCPHREKNGWTGDAQLSAEQVLCNFLPMTAYTKWLTDFRDEQRPNGALPGIVPSPGWGYGVGPAWDSAYVLLPWYLYVYCGDTRILAEHYAGMRRYVDYLSTVAEGHIVSLGLGDWCPPLGGASGHKCPAELTSTGYYYADALIVGKVAAILGKEADARAFAALAEDIRRAFVAKYLDRATGMLAGNNQTSMACGLYWGMIDEGDRSKVLAALLSEVDAHGGHIDCGILGAKYVMQALTDAGRADATYRIATQTTFPSWGNWIERGATTLWESWDGASSRNHHMFSDISAWFYKALAGINADPAEPGFRHVIIRPWPVAGLDWARGEIRSMHGTISSSWRKEAGTLKLDVAIPVNTTATVHVPASDPRKVRESGRVAARAAGVTSARAEDGRAVFDVGSGTYSFEAPYGK